MQDTYKKLKTEFVIRQAVKEDAEKIASLLAPYAEQKLLLPRTPDEISSHIANFKVAEKDGLIVGCCALRNYGNSLFEIRSLAVEKKYNNLGIGSALVQACLKKAARNGKARVFALTYRPELFKRLGFKSVSKTLFPQKIWTDCSVCSKRHNCDEEAVLLEVNENA